MRTYYVDVRFGSDTSGDGTVARPYKTITKAADLLDHGDEIAVDDAGPDNLQEILFSEAGTISIVDKINVSIRFLKSPGKTKTSLVWKPTAVSPALKATLYIQNCSNIRIEGAVFMSQSPLTDHAHAIRVLNSTDVVVSKCIIHSAWQVDNSAIGELISAYNSVMTVSGCSSDGLNNSYSNYLAFISVDGAGEYNLFTNTFQNLHSNNGTVYGIKVGPETRKVTIDGFLAHNIQSDLADRAIGIFIESDNSQVEFIVNGAQFSTLHTGIYIKDIPNGNKARRIKRSTFFNVRRALVADHALVELYNVSAHSQPTITHMYPPGHSQTLETFGVFALAYSQVDVLNSIFTGFGTALYAEMYSTVTAEYIVWNTCTLPKNSVDHSKVSTIQYVRRTDPQYENLGAVAYGDFTLKDGSSCIDSGKAYGDLFLGLAPDIGAKERSRAIRVDDLPALIARSNRYTTKIPLTNIDIEGMITRGLDTYDPEIQSGREGSAVKDIAVKPLIGLLAPYTTALESVRSDLSFLNIATMSDDAADALASNLFVTRKTGNLASGVIRIYFESPTSVVIPAEAQFRTNSGLKYYTRQETSMSAEEMALNFENNLYFMDAIVEAEAEGIQYNIASGAISTPLTPMPSSIVALVNPNPIVGGAAAETNYQLRDRIKTAITVRDLVTKKGITYVIPDLFDFVKAIRPIGFHDVEMLRDEVLGYHIGGKVDIYVRPRVLIEDTKIIEVADAENSLALADWGNVPIVQISKIEVLDAATMDSMDIWLPPSQYSIRVNNPKTRFAISEDNTLLISRDYVGLPLKVYYKWASEIRALQQWVESSEHRVVCADLLIKHFLPTFIDFSIAYYADAEVTALQTLLELFVNDVSPDKPLQVSDVIDYCYSVGVDYVGQPTLLHGETHMSDGAIVEQESETELLIERTSVFIANNITVNYLGVDPNK